MQPFRHGAWGMGYGAWAWAGEAGLGMRHCSLDQLEPLPIVQLSRSLSWGAEVEGWMVRLPQRCKPTGILAKKKGPPRSYE